MHIKHAPLNRETQEFAFLFYNEAFMNIIHMIISIMDMMTPQYREHLKIYRSLTVSPQVSPTNFTETDIEKNSGMEIS